MPTAMQTRRRRNVEDQTGKSLDEWFALLDSVDGKHKSHHELWRWLVDARHLESGMVREEVVIAYEQHIGRREEGQSCLGDFPASVTRTYRESIDIILAQWLARMADRTEFNGVRLAAEPTSSGSGKFRYWRAKLEDGTQVQVTMYAAADGRTSLGIQHRAFANKPSAQRWRDFWKSVLTA